MTEIYGLFDAADPMDPDRIYTSAAFARLIKTMMRDGVVNNDGDELAVSPTVPAAMSVSVGTGMALVQGRYYINDGDLPLPVDAADPSHPRIDRVVVRLEATPGRTVHCVVKKGTPAPSPVPPGLTRTAETWELSLAQIRVEAGATSIVAGKIADERGNTSLCGVAAPVYVPSSQVEVVGAVNMQSNALTGLPVPSAAGDAARKGYVDTEIAGAIGGFGISQIAIDADKNWSGKSITNVRIDTGSSCTLVSALPSDTVRTASNGVASGKGVYPNMVKHKEIILSANHRGIISYRVKYRAYCQSGLTYSDIYSQIYVNGLPRGTLNKTTNGTPVTYIEDISGLNPGDKIQIYAASAIQYASQHNPVKIDTFQLCADYISCPLPIVPTNTVVM